MILRWNAKTRTNTVALLFCFVLQNTCSTDTVHQIVKSFAQSAVVWCICLSSLSIQLVQNELLYVKADWDRPKKNASIDSYTVASVYEYNAQANYVLVFKTETYFYGPNKIYLNLSDGAKRAYKIIHVVTSIGVVVVMLVFVLTMNLLCLQPERF